MPDWTDLKAAMASCWKVVWNVDPLALRVPLRALPDPPVVEGEPDEEHAARASVAAAVAAAASVTCFCLEVA